ncbi:MAG: HD domain-containing protein [Candidatus Kerfeldbacteria bacterium]|nr:HD domain-containing protein [Candidatus Kerfeldbacteria bacterium]
MTRADALVILDEFVKNANLKKHMLAVEAAMRAYAPKFGGDPEEWGIVGLLHDFDWEIHPTLDDHPIKGQSILAERGVPERIRHAILAHAPRTGVKPETPMEKALFACDEISGFIVAVSLMTPNKKLADVTIEGIEKKLKRKDFAAKVNRQEINDSIQLLGVPRNEHIQNVLQAMQGIHNQLGL